MPFSHAPVGGQGVIVVPQIQSPNYDKAAGTGWRIGKDGSAYFADVQLPNVKPGTTATFSATAPASPQPGDLWYDTGNGMLLHQWAGTEWAPYQVGTEAIADGAVTNSQLASSVTARSLGGVTTTISATAPASPLTGDLWVNSASGYQLERYSGTAWTAISWDAASVLAAGSVGATLLSSSITARSLGGITTTISPTAPAAPATGDIWLNSASGYQLNQYSGSSWTAVQWTATNVISAGTINASLIEAATITGALIAAGTITAANIAANTITAANIAAGAITAAQIAAGTITGANIASGTITAANIAAGTITAAQIAAGTVVAGIVNGTTITGATIVADGGNGEILVYSGTPAAGNLIASVSGAAGTDSHGNAYNQGIWAYNANGSSMGMVPIGGQTQLNMTPAGATKTTADTAAYAGVTNPGAANENQWLILTSGKSNGERDAGILLNSEPADASASEYILFDLGGQDTLYVNRAGVYTFPATPLAVYGESWHNMTLSNGWTVGSGGRAQYKLMPDNTVMIRMVNVQPGTASNGIVIWAWPSGYAPVTEMKLQVTTEYSTAPASTSRSMVYLYANPGGGLELENVSGTISNIHITGSYPLD